MLVAGQPAVKDPQKKNKVGGKKKQKNRACQYLQAVSFLSHLANSLITLTVGFLHLSEVVNGGGCAISQQDLHFFSQNAHEAHGQHVYWQTEEMYEGGSSP